MLEISAMWSNSYVEIRNETKSLKINNVENKLSDSSVKFGSICSCDFSEKGCNLNLKDADDVYDSKHKVMTDNSLYSPLGQVR